MIWNTKEGWRFFFPGHVMKERESPKTELCSRQGRNLKGGFCCRIPGLAASAWSAWSRYRWPEAARESPRDVKTSMNSTKMAHIIAIETQSSSFHCLACLLMGFVLPIFSFQQLLFLCLSVSPLSSLPSSLKKVSTLLLWTLFFGLAKAPTENVTPKPWARNLPSAFWRRWKCLHLHFSRGNLHELLTCMSSSEKKHPWHVYETRNTDGSARSANTQKKT